MLRRFATIGGLSLALVFASASSWLFIPGPTWVPTDKVTGTMSYWHRGDSNTLSTTDVATLVDKSGNGVTITFASGRRPVYNASKLNGQPCWEGVAGRTVYGTTGGTTAYFDQAQEWSAVFVFRGQRESVGDFSQQFGAYSTGTRTLGAYTVNTLTTYGDFNIGYGGGTNDVKVATLDYYNAPIYLAVDYDGSSAPSTAGSWRIWRNGVSQTVAASSTAGANLNTYIGAPTSGKSINGSGYGCELISWKGSGAKFTAGDLTGMASYFAGRYGL